MFETAARFTTFTTYCMDKASHLIDWFRRSGSPEWELSDCIPFFKFIAQLASHLPSPQAAADDTDDT